jgi:hypothetical protein
MVKLEEIRIGNWFKHNDIVSTQHFPDDIFQWSISDFWAIESSRMFIASIEPIPISDEILKGAKLVRGIGNEYVFGRFNLRPRKDNCELYISGNDAHFHWIRGVHFVHELQNILFALTGRELELNLEPVTV